MSWLNRPASETQITHGQRLWLYILATVIMILLVAPTIIVIPMSFSASQYLEFPPREWSLRWYEHYLNSPEWIQATWTSLKAGFFTMCLATPIGTAAAYGLFVTKHPLSRMFYVLLITPIMIPVILIAIAAFYVFVQIKMVNSMFGLVIAHSILALPLVLIVISAALKSFDMNLEMAARSLGASRFTAFMDVTLPQIRFSVMTAALLSFLTSFDEVIVAMFVSGGENSTLTRNMFNALRDQIDPTIASISTIMIVISSSLLILTQLFRKSGD
ncbi:ABC transporter permease [uncultured Nisaea sp.]|jgi:putative spermidine/putrescine transport system permease protein|uniref:ABC transporter permease n=1 Tax=uncultured Nisaea sp. TaxID=538215 RepID=UPI0030EF7B48|tara:strand:+ start:856 stop:1671 length:816 start_codon:yes stop_codon:yes gene_type:complete